ncbi:Eco29kI family restriction endonuclease [Micromonospora sp. NPDC005171]|uniref:Eco29kI family restriction endonuclease n=1 Tax=Micromonospora sp. NPDC005171 TaxID=3156866 RepID=UPI0033BE2406
MAEQDYLAELGAELMRLRAAKGWTTQQLAIRCRRSRTSISQALNTRQGRPMPSLDTVSSICQVLGGDTRRLLTLLNKGRSQQNFGEAGPLASDGSRQFTREPSEPGPGELDGLYNPLRRENLERSVQWALEAAPTIPLARQPLTKGDGIYAIYYIGSHELYQPVSTPRCSVPLFVGSTRASRPRRNSSGLPEGGGLRRRLLEHRRTIEQCDSLRLVDFQVRYLPVEEMFVPGAERLLVGDHQPVWNTVLEGFGFHSPGKARMARRSPWDELHPGRPWAANTAPNRRSGQELRAAVRRHLFRNSDERT